MIRYALQALGPTYEETLAWARFAESRGLDAFAIPDHYLRRTDDTPEPAHDALVVMAGLARETTSIELVLLVSPVTWRHPAVLAKSYASLHEMSGGRITLGVGTGWMEREHQLFGFPFPELGERFDMLEEALGYLRAAFADPPQPFSGKHYSFEAFDIQPRPPLRMVVGGKGPKRTPELAGRYCDEFNAYPAPPEAFAAKVALARQAATDAGRDPDALLISSSGVLTAADDEAGYRKMLEVRAAELSVKVEELEESMRMRNSPRGTWEQVREVLGGLADAGMQRFYIQVATDDRDAVDHALERLRA
jgi:alkanesulfonate monooxygenase SsuD/methylene tetrahydromethanopterin reductase-like flavin-dependent oxidoreductase (luciferase family)